MKSKTGMPDWQRVLEKMAAIAAETPAPVEHEETPHIVDSEGRSPKKVVVHKDRRRRPKRPVRGRNKGGGGGGGAPWTNVYCVARDDGEYAYDGQVMMGSRIVMSKTIRANSWDEAKDLLLDELAPGQHAILDQEHIGGKPVVRRRRAQYAESKKASKKKAPKKKAAANRAPVQVLGIAEAAAKTRSMIEKWKKKKLNQTPKGANTGE